MATPVNIKGTNNEVAQVAEGGLVVTSTPAPAATLDTITSPYIGFMTPTGLGGDEDLTLDGSTTEIDVFIEAENDADIYIKEIKVLVVDNAVLALTDFGAIATGLTNGLLPFYRNKGVDISFTERPLFTNFDILRVGSKSPEFGVDDTAWRIKGAKGGGSDYAYLGVWDMTQVSPGNVGIRLVANSGQRLGVKIRDDLTTLTSFEILCIGYRRLL